MNASSTFYFLLCFRLLVLDPRLGLVTGFLQRLGWFFIVHDMVGLIHKSFIITFSF